MRAAAPAASSRIETVGRVALAFPLGHFYSPIPDLDEVEAQADRVFAADRDPAGIDLGLERQLARLDEFAGLCVDLPYPASGPVDGLRYRYDNPFFASGDGIAYACMLRSIRPDRVIEIGSGWSSALALDIDERFLGSATEMTFIEPFPDRLESLLDRADEDRVRILRQPLADVDPAVFADLGAGDILFVDSTHVSKIGSDVNQIVFDILPTLQRGVHVHVHDVFFPFEYPADWVFGGRAWNENYLLRAFLIDNARFRITWFNSLLAAGHYEDVAARLGHWGINSGGSIWLEVV